MARSIWGRAAHIALLSLTILSVLFIARPVAAEVPPETPQLAVTSTPADLEIAEAAPAGYVPISSHSCVDFPFTQHHNVLIYAYPSDKPNQEVTEVPRIRREFAYAQDTLYVSAKRRGVIASYKTICNSQLQPEVVVVKLPTTAANTTYDTIVADLKAKGFSRNTSLFWVEFDGTSTECGKAVMVLDEQPGAANGNNQGARFGVSFKTIRNGALTPCNVLQHEAAHLMGAVQNGAPTSNQAQHCQDGTWNDILCNGPQQCPGSLTPTAKAFDCNNDDYFDPHPVSGSYLATHWNLGSCAQNWIELSSCPSKLGTVTYDSAHAAIRYSAGWTHQTGVANAIGATISSASQVNSSASLDFTGSSVTVFFSKQSTADRVTVYIDNQLVDAVDMRSPETRNQVARTYEVPYGPHTILVIHSPTRGGSLYLDAFAINIAKVGTGSYDNTHGQLRYSGAWSHVTPAPNAFNDTLSWTRNGGDVVRFTFVGTSLSYVYDKAPNRGIVTVTIDGIDYPNIDQYSVNTVRQVSMPYNNLGPGIHVVTIGATGTKRSESTQPYITVDRLVVSP